MPARCRTGQNGRSVGIVNVTKRTPTPPEPSPRRRSRVPEINALLGRWDDPARLAPWERDYLLEQGFGLELEATRKRPPKISADAKAELLLFHLKRLEGDARRVEQDYLDAPRYLYDFNQAPSIAHRFLLDWGEHEAAALFTSESELDTPADAWHALVEKYPHLQNRLIGAVSRAVEREAKRAREKYERLRVELGEAFIGGTVDREASVRKWTQRLRSREKA